MGEIIELLAVIPSLIVRAGLFYWINTTFNITYFGCYPIVFLMIVCFLVPYAIITHLGVVLLGLLKWVLIGGAIYCGIKFLKAKSNEN